MAKTTNKVFKTDFLIYEANMAFIEALILYYFDPENHIWIKTDASRYTISGILRLLTLDEKFSGHVIGKNPNFFESGQ